MNTLFQRYPALTVCEGDIRKATEALIACFARGNKLLLCGNGGSAADCDHIVGELAKGFLKRRPIPAPQKEAMKQANPALNDAVLNKLQCGLPAISLPAMTALGTAFCNDMDAELVYAQALLSLAKSGDVLLAISTSGSAKNVAAAVDVAKALGVTVIGLTGEDGGALAKSADIAIRVPEKETFKIQELHLPVYHYICAAVEAHFFNE